MDYQAFRLPKHETALNICRHSNQEPIMRREDRDKVWNPFGEVVDDLSLAERDDRLRARAWAWYLNGGGGDPSWFDYPAYSRSAERNMDRER
jgi:hypothetical protein